MARAGTANPQAIAGRVHDPGNRTAPDTETCRESSPLGYLVVTRHAKGRIAAALSVVSLVVPQGLEPWTR